MSVEAKNFNIFYICGYTGNLRRVSLYNKVQWNPDFSNLQGKRKLVGEIGEFEKSGVKLQCLTEERERLLVRVIGRFEKMRVREIGIPL